MKKVQTILNREKIGLVVSLLLLVGCNTIPNIIHQSGSASDPDITAEEVISHIKYLASDGLKGRYPGTPESRQVQEYIIRQFKRNGILPAGEDGKYRQYFDFVSGLQLEDDNTLQFNGRDYSVTEDFIPLGFSGNGNIKSGIVFVGYGFNISDSIQWNDYDGIDVNGKWVLVLRGDPEGDNPHSEFSKHVPLRKKALVARDKGAAGILFVSRFEDNGADELLPLKYDHSATGAGFPVIHINQSVAEQIINSAGYKLKNLQKIIDEKKEPNSFELPGTLISGQVSITKSIEKVANILGVIPGNDLELKNQYVVIGAHYDHLGLGGEGSRAPDTIAVHNGADDNASGVAALLEISEKLAANRDKLKRTVLLMCYDAEEEGTLGSKYFVDHPTINLEDISVMINLDMVGRMDEDKLKIGGTGTSSEFETILNEVNRTHNLVLKMSSEGYGPSDHAPFYVSNIPVLFFFTGSHQDYHMPSDDWDKINPQGEKQVADFVYSISEYFSQSSNKPVYTEAGPKEPTQVSRSFKVTFGVIPSYGSEEEGMEIDGTRKDGPADKAGMKKGDIIIEINGKQVTNIYDYMYRLGELKPGQAVNVKVKRNEEVLSLQLQL